MYFAVFNFLTNYFQIFKGPAVGLFATASFLTAVIHSFFWNRHLVFRQAGERTSLLKDFAQFGILGALGATAIIIIGFGTDKQYQPIFYLLLLFLIFICEVIFWYGFSVGKNIPAKKSSQEFLLFVGITAVGLLINSSLVIVITDYIAPQLGLGAGTWAFLAKAAATGVSLVWNFAGYKLFIFKK